MRYHVSVSDPSGHFIRLVWHIDYIHQPVIHIRLPAWRPGRYELQNYAKNVRCFAIHDQDGQPVSYKKTGKDVWEVDTQSAKQLTVSYEYYANQYDAGASYADASQLYLNPVNCFMYVEGRMDEEYTIELDIAADHQIACQLPVSGKTLTAKNFDHLADSPFIASPSLSHHSFVQGDTTFHFWFQGSHSFDLELLGTHTRQYARAQTDLFGELPCKDYHFLYHMLDRPFRHGVEHLDSTVIAMGQGENEMRQEFYDSFLAISSHELFHLWNIKRIRPEEMFPYDFTKENYSTLGYVYEGVTTYYGDLMLLRSGVWGWEQYAASFNNDLGRHFTNPGRFNYSVAESSWDTWLDGYVPGIPGRKVSIYIEGMLAALIADIMILDGSKGKYRLDDVMKDLYAESKEGKPYTETIYRELLEKYAGCSFGPYFKEVIWGRGKIRQWLDEKLPLIGLSLQQAGNKEEYVISTPPDKSQKLFERWSGS